MTPARAALGLAVLLGLLAFAALKVDTDVRGLLGEDDQVTSALDTPEGRALTLAIIDPDPDKRSLLAAEIAETLATRPLVRRVTTAPEAPTTEFLDWIWQHRFVLAPPPQAAFTPQSLVSEMRRARAALLSASDAALADRYLRDPTGSFRRAITALTAASAKALPVHRGIPQARDNSAALIFIELADEPFDVAVEAAFDADLISQVRAGGADALLIGPRAISAEISNDIATRSTLAAAVASALLLLWLVCVLRPASAMLVCVLPPAMGFAAAALVVQVSFGSVHVIALGFGGALLGLALDYPLHLLAHRAGPGQNHRARRFVAVGAATTAIAFLALLGSGIPAIGQVGLFVASGLTVAAACAIWLADRGQPASLRSFAPVMLPFVVPLKLPALAAFALVCAATLWQLPERTSQRLVEVPPRITDAIKRLSTMIDLPSGRYRIDVTGKTLEEVLVRQARLAQILQIVSSAESFPRSEMLGNYLPKRLAKPKFPSPEAFSETLSGLLAEAGLDPDFLGDITASYKAAHDIPPSGPQALGPFEHLAAIPGLIRVDGDILRAPVRLWSVAAPDRVAQIVGGLRDEGIVFVDQERSIASGLDALTARVSLWLGLGVLAGVLFLLLAIRRPMVVAEIALGCLAAGLLTALLVGIPTGGVGVFHIMALTLVIGIGIDYGIFLTLSEDDKQYQDATRSVLLCAATTLIAFLTMAFSGVSVLEEIGATVSIGVIAMVVVHGARQKITWPAEER
ncbi:MAG TPA: MMPL family transporter [Thermohalobaculum sp.]|nr:MMPL family transporter [Thermohalobaculum sp.]